jgi:hypothetical protein
MTHAPFNFLDSTANGTGLLPDITAGSKQFMREHFGF